MDILHRAAPCRNVPVTFTLDLTIRAMHDYVVYHKAELMGYGALDVNRLAIYTKKPAEDAVGGRVWLIAGEGSHGNTGCALLSSSEVSAVPISPGSSTWSPAPMVACWTQCPF